MNNQQLYLAIGIPSLFALVGIATNITLYVFLAGRIDRKTERTEDKIESVRTEINGSIKAIGDRLHDDMQNIMGRDREMDKRVMKLEGERQQ